jgi:hypothetical protein
MPETAKVNGREDAPSNAEEPGIGANKVVKHSVEISSGEHKAAPSSPEGPQEPEASKETQPEPSEEKSAHNVGDNIANRPAEAIETKDEEGTSEESDSSNESDSSDPEHEEGYFTGWDGLDDIHELSAEEEIADEEEQSQPFEGGAGHRTLAEIALASGTFPTLEGSSDPGTSVSSKHNELADAVQAALLSVYGEAPAAPPSRRALPFSPESPASGPGWASEDNLSPQDVILNYFDYPGPGKSRSAVSNHTEARYNGDTPDVFGQPPDYASSQRRPQWSSSYAAHAEYDDLSAYPHSAGHEVPSKAADAEERESSRLLGAAAIGLVGGIAIAASLAVFVINSYGPGDRAAAGAASQMLDASQPGYGRLIKGNAELEASKPTADASPPEAAPVIAAADAPVTSGQPSPLAIEVKPEQANEKTLISITGIPEGARLNAGIDAGGGNWLLPPRRLNGLTINVPAGSPDTVSLGVQVLDSNVRTPLSDKKQFAIRVNPARTEPATPTAVQRAAPTAAQPVAQAPIPPSRAQPEIAALQRPQPEPTAVPETPKPAKPAPSFFSTETVPAAASGIAPQAELRGKPASSAGAAQQAAPSRQAALQTPGALADPAKGAPRTEIEDLIRGGNKRMKEGDILEARRLYQKAVALGDPEAALAMGRSYDPIYFARIDKKNAEPDAAKAFDWYRKAMDGGASQTAKVRIENLKHFLNQ